MNILDSIYKIIMVIGAIPGILALVGKSMGVGDSWVEQNFDTRKHKLVRLIANIVIVFILLLLINMLCSWMGNDIHYDIKIIVDCVNICVFIYDVFLVGFIICILFKQKRLPNENIVANWQVVLAYIGMCIMQFAISSTYHEFNWFLTIIICVQVTFIWTYSWANTYELDKSRIFFIENGEKKYIYHRLNDTFVICGKERNMRDRVEMKGFSEINEVQFLINEKNCENNDVEKNKDSEEKSNSEMITNKIEKEMYREYKKFLKNQLTKMQFEKNIEKFLDDKKINVQSEIERTNLKKMKNSNVKVSMLQFAISILVALLPILFSLILGITTITKDGIYTEISVLSNEMVVESERMINGVTEISAMLSELLLDFTACIIVWFIAMLIIGLLMDWGVESRRAKKNHFYSMLEEILKKENSESLI